MAVSAPVRLTARTELARTGPTRSDTNRANLRTARTDQDLRTEPALKTEPQQKRTCTNSGHTDISDMVLSFKDTNFGVELVDAADA